MSTIIIGLFPTQNDAKKIALDLENSGFENKDYIVYLNKENDAQEKNIWERLFGGRTPKFIPEEKNTLITSVEIKDEKQLQIAKDLFSNHEAIHIYELNDINISEAESLDYLKKIVNTRAKSEVYSTPTVASAKLVTLNQGILLN